MLRRLAALALLALGCGCGESPVRIVLVTLDTLRSDAFLGEGSAMPALQARAARGLVFLRSYSAAPQTQPTHATLLTGLHPWKHGVVDNGLVLDDRFVTVAERLRERGFATAAVVASFPLDPRFGFAQGFDEYDAVFTRSYSSEWEGEKVPEGRFMRLADEVNEAAFRILDGLEGDRQFLWVHYFDPHAPYGDTAPEAAASFDGVAAGIETLVAQRKGGAAPPEAAFAALQRDFLGVTRSRYDLDVRYLDTALDALLARLEREARRFETHVVVVADHGESFGEEGVSGHGNRLNDAELHVPLFILSPRVEAGTRLEPVGSIDVARTLLDLAGISTPGLGGRSLLEPVPRRDVVAGMREDTQARRLHFYVVEGDALLRGDSQAVSRAPDPAADAAAEGALDAATQQRVRALFAGYARELEGAEALTDPETREALEALGYGR